MIGATKKIQNIYLKYLEDGIIPLPRIIHVETRSKCNGCCGFCPSSITADRRQDLYMPDELIEKIINELNELQYQNRLSFYNNNEPFLDKRIFDITKSAREKLPGAYLELKSNGLVLNTEKIHMIFNAGLDMLYINDYSNNNQFHKNVQKIKGDLEQIRRYKGHLEKDQYFNRINISIADQNAVKGTRAGNSPNKAYKKKYIQKMCLRPFEMMTINPEGDTSVCSEDMYCTINMGNIKNQTLLEIWRSEKWDNVRKRLIKGDRSFKSTCSKCDYKGLTHEILLEHRMYKGFLSPGKKKIAIKLINKL